MAGAQHCPGQDPRFWKAEDVSEEPCIHCGKVVEFFKDDLRRKCPYCRQMTYNPHHDLACAAWCPSAEQCLAQYGRSLPGDEGPVQ